MLELRERMGLSAKRRAIVRYARSLDAEGVYSYGYAISHSDRWLLTHYIADHLRLDGYDAVRVEDLTEVDLEFDKAEVLARCISMKHQRAQRPKAIDLRDTKALCRSIAVAYPLVVIHRERINPDECEVGALKMAGNDSYALRWMTPAAQWADDERVYSFDDITRVTFGGEYETTLAAISGLIENPF